MHSVPKIRSCFLSRSSNYNVRLRELCIFNFCAVRESRETRISRTTLIATRTVFSHGVSHAAIGLVAESIKPRVVHTQEPSWYHVVLNQARKFIFSPAAKELAMSVRGPDK